MSWWDVLKIDWQTDELFSEQHPTAAYPHATPGPRPLGKDLDILPKIEPVFDELVNELKKLFPDSDISVSPQWNQTRKWHFKFAAVDFNVSELGQLPRIQSLNNWVRVIYSNANPGIGVNRPISVSGGPKATHNPVTGEKWEEGIWLHCKTDNEELKQLIISMKPKFEAIENIDEVFVDFDFPPRELLTPEEVKENRAWVARERKRQEQRKVKKMNWFTTLKGLICPNCGKPTLETAKYVRGAKGYKYKDKGVMICSECGHKEVFK